MAVRCLVLASVLHAADAFTPAGFARQALAPRATERAPAGVSSPSGTALCAASTDDDLAWDANAEWLEQCSTSGVVSWYDVGLRLTAPETASTPRGD